MSGSLATALSLVDETVRRHHKNEDDITTQVHQADLAIGRTRRLRSASSSTMEVPGSASPSLPGSTSDASGASDPDLGTWTGIVRKRCAFWEGGTRDDVTRTDDHAEEVSRRDVILESEAGSSVASDPFEEVLAELAILIAGLGATLDDGEAQVASTTIPSTSLRQAWMEVACDSLELRQSTVEPLEEPFAPLRQAFAEPDVDSVEAGQSALEAVEDPPFAHLRQAFTELAVDSLELVTCTLEAVGERSAPLRQAFAELAVDSAGLVQSTFEVVSAPFSPSAAAPASGPCQRSQPRLPRSVGDFI